MINAIPVIGWIVSALMAVSMAVPFWLIWTVLGIGDAYFYWLPQVYRTPSFWGCVGVFICISILKAVALGGIMSATAKVEGKE